MGDNCYFPGAQGHELLGRTFPPFVYALIRRGVITVDPKEATTCCALPRDDDGFCIYRPGHPIYVEEGSW